MFSIFSNGQFVYIALFKNLAFFFSLKLESNQRKKVGTWGRGRIMVQSNKQIKTHKKKKTICTLDCEVDEMES